MWGYEGSLFLHGILIILGDYYSGICYELLLRLQFLNTGSGQTQKFWFYWGRKAFIFCHFLKLLLQTFFFALRFGELLLSAKCSSFCHVWRAWKQSLAGSFGACGAEVENRSDAGHMLILKCLFWCFCICDATVISEPSNKSRMPRILSHKRPGHLLYYTFMNIPIQSKQVEEIRNFHVQNAFRGTITCALPHCCSRSFYQLLHSEPGGTVEEHSSAIHCKHRNSKHDFQFVSASRANRCDI